MRHPRSVLYENLYETKQYSELLVFRYLVCSYCIINRLLPTTDEVFFVFVFDQRIAWLCQQGYCSVKTPFVVERAET